MTPEDLGRKLREDGGDDLKRRRAVAGLSLFNVLSMGLISLYQIGLLKHVPEPPLPGFDADKINGSAQAYELLNTPDAFLAAGSYAATAVLAAMGPPARARTDPWVPLAMAAKSALDAALAVKLLIDQPRKYKAFSLWCLFSAAAALFAAPLAWPEAREALRHLQGADR